MAKNDAKKCMEWLSQQQEAMEGESMGRGKGEVVEALTRQKNRTKEIQQFRETIDRVLDTQKLSDDAKKELDSTYNRILTMSQRREECLTTVSQVAGTEDLIQGLSSEFDSKAQHLVNAAASSREQAIVDLCTQGALSNETMARASQSCIQAVRVNWRWLTLMAQCAQVHLRNTAAYHEFFHESEEAEHWMNTTLSHIHLTFDRSKLEGSRADALAIQSEIKEILSAFLHWQTKTDSLFDKARTIVPVPQRTTTLTTERSVLALADYSNSKIKFIEGETLFLMDNSDRKTWKVRNNAGQTGAVPAIIILIPAPHLQATDTALRLRKQLLALWTGSVKRLGYQLIAFMLLVFRDWSQEEVSLLQRLSPGERDDVMRVLHYLEMTLLQHNWQGYGDFMELQERIHRLVIIIEEAADETESDNQFLITVVIQIRTLEELLRKYQDFWAFWETFRTLVELAHQPELILVCDKWEQLHYRATAHLVKFWDTNLDLTEGDLTKQTASLALHQTPSNMFSDVTFEEQQQDTTTETVNTSVTEEQFTYIVKGVVDPRDNQSQLDLQTAIMMGIVDQAQGLYVNPATGATMTIKEALSEGKLMIQALSQRKLREEKNAYGMLTIKTKREIRPFAIHAVRDPVSNRVLTVEEATQNGVLTPDAAYRTATGESINLHVAIERGLLDVTYDEDEGSAKAEVISKTYAVHGVVDQRRKEKISFTDAVRLGLLDRSTGEYLNNVTHERVPATEAIMRGFIKARFVADPSKLDIDPRNQIVIQKLENAKKKLMHEIHTVRAFKSMLKQH